MAGKLLEELAAESRELASGLFGNEFVSCTQHRDDNSSCVMAEEQRSLTAAEKKEGWIQRPFWAYQPARMCAGCAAYWFAERLAQTLHELYCWQRRNAAKERGNHG